MSAIGFSVAAIVTWSIGFAGALHTFGWIGGLVYIIGFNATVILLARQVRP